MEVGEFVDAAVQVGVHFGELSCAGFDDPLRRRLFARNAVLFLFQQVGGEGFVVVRLQELSPFTIQLRQDLALPFNLLDIERLGQLDVFSNGGSGLFEVLLVKAELVLVVQLHGLLDRSDGDEALFTIGAVLVPAKAVEVLVDLVAALGVRKRHLGPAMSTEQ